MSAKKHGHAQTTVVFVLYTCRTRTRAWHVSDTSQLIWLVKHGQTSHGHDADSFDTVIWLFGLWVDPTRYHIYP